MKYVRDLAQADDNVRSVSPQIGKEKRPFVGIIVICENKKYCIPLSSPKPKHQNMKNDVDFSKIYNKNKLIGVLNFNNMIPIDEKLIKPIDLSIKKEDTPDKINYKKLTTKQLDWCQKNQNDIIKKATKLYKIITETTKKSHNLTHRCCDFKKLEAVLEKNLEKDSKKGLIDKCDDIKAWADNMKDKIKDIEIENDKSPVGTER